MTPIYNPSAGGGPVLLVRRNANCAESWLPAAPPASVASTTTIWNPGAFSPLGTPAQDFVLSYAHIVNYCEAQGLEDSTIGFVWGAVANKLDCAREIAPFFNPQVTTAWALPLSIMCQPVVSPAGQLISVYAATSGNFARTFAVTLMGWLGGLPTFDSIPLGIVAGHGYWLPSDLGDTAIALTTGAAWAWGNPATVLNPLTHDALVVGIKGLYSLPYIMDPADLFQVGYGPAGSETWCVTIPSGRTWNTRWVWPPVLVKAGERLAVRGTSNIARTKGLQFKLYGL